MMELEKVQKPRGKMPQKLRLTNIASTKKSLSRLINSALDQNADLPAIRTAIYGCNCLLTAFRIDIEERLERLEEIANAQDR